MTLPNFLIIGAPKAGTTSLYHALKKHPQIFMPSLKEVNFFTKVHSETEEGIREYRSLFNPSEDQSVIGEASTSYLFDLEAPKRIYAAVPDVKLIAILRNPADRIYSDYWMRRRRGDLIINTDKGRIQDHFSQLLDYHEKSFLYSFYWQSLGRYLNFFDKSQIKICFFEDLKQNPHKLYLELCDFLEVRGDLLPSSSQKVYNKGGKAKNDSLFKLLENTRRRYAARLLTALPKELSEPLRNAYVAFRDNILLSDVPPLPKDTRKLLVDTHRDDVLELQDFIDRDLSHWLLY